MNPLTTSDLAPLRRMLGSHSMVVRVNSDGSLMPFEIMPELFLGRSIRQLLSGSIRGAFEKACRVAIDTRVPQSFVPTELSDTDEVMITPVIDNGGTAVRLLVVWARSADLAAGPANANVQWPDLKIDDVEVRFRAIGANRIEAAPSWSVSNQRVDLWAHQQQVAAVGMASTVTTELAIAAVDVLAEHEDAEVRICIPAADMLSGLMPVLHGLVRASGVAAERLVIAVPVELACDGDFLPIIVHLRTMGAQIDIVGLDALTSTLHRVSDTSDLEHAVPTGEGVEPGRWTTDSAVAVRDSIAKPAVR